MSVQNLIFTIMWACYCYGGVHSPFIPWLVTVPLLAFFYYNWPVKLRFALIGLVALYLGVFYGLYKSGYAFPPVAACRTSRSSASSRPSPPRSTSR